MYCLLDIIGKHFQTGRTGLGLFRPEEKSEKKRPADNTLSCLLYCDLPKQRQKTSHKCISNSICYGFVASEDKEVICNAT